MEAIGGILLFVFLLCLYFIPVGIALYRKRSNTVQIALVNFFFGWIIIGWVIALIMAFGTEAQTNITVVQKVGQEQEGEEKENVEKENV